MNALARLLVFVWAYVRTRYGARFRSRAALEAWQSRKVARYLARVLPKSPYTRARLEAAGDWRLAEPIGKAEMMAHFDTLNTVGVRRDEAMALALRAERERDFSPTLGPYTVGLSSGTSGNRGLFVVAPEERALWAGTILAKVLPGSLFGRHRIALFLRANSNLYGSVRALRIAFAFFDLIEPIASLVEKLERYAPTMLVAPASMLRLLAEAKLRGELRIEPTRIVSVAEVLEPLDEARIERAFGQRVHQVYQATEGFLGASCPEGTLHLNEDLVVVEKEPLGEGENGQRFVPILTDFTRTSQPIVRYRLNDVLTERDTPCPCGSPHRAIARIEGRCDDVLYGVPAAEGARMPMAEGALVPVFADFVSRAVITASDRVEAYVVRQHAPDHVELALAFATESGDDNGLEAERRRVVEAVASTFRRFGCVPPRIETSDDLEYGGMKKLRRVQRLFAIEDDGPAALAGPAPRAGRAHHASVGDAR